MGGTPSSSLPLFGLLAWGTITLLHFFNFFGGDSRSLSPHQPRPVSLPHSPRHLLSQDDTGQQTSQLLQHGSVGELENSTFLSLDLEENRLKADNEQKRWEEEQFERRELVQKVCASYRGLGREKVKLDSFLYSAEHQLLYCRNAKVGTTTWLAHFLNISDLTLEQKAVVNTSRLLHKVVPPLFKVPRHLLPISKLAEATVSFSMVRHPFERLVSAYQDKIVDNTDPSYTHIASKLKREYGEVSFHSFALYVLDTAKHMCLPPPARCHLDVHWRPFYARCAFCTTHYKVIAKAETFSTDLEQIGRLAGIHFPTLVTHHSSGDTSELAATYFRQVPVDVVDELAHLYKPDLAMFGYSVDTYIALAQKVNVSNNANLNSDPRM